jgi:hypothetical protein
MIALILKRNIPNLEMIELGHPTGFSRETKPSVEKYENLICTSVDIFASYAESCKCDVEGILDKLSEDEIQSVFEVFKMKMGNGPTTSERNEEFAAQIAQSKFLNGKAQMYWNTYWNKSISSCEGEDQQCTYWKRAISSFEE